jgi:hypothetical protein
MLPCVFRYLSFCVGMCVCVWGLAHENFIVWYQILTSHAWWWCLCTSHHHRFLPFCHRKVKWKSNTSKHGLELITVCVISGVWVSCLRRLPIFFQHYLSRCNVKSIYTKTQYLNTHLFLTLSAFMRHWYHLVGMMVWCVGVLRWCVAVQFRCNVNDICFWSGACCLDKLFSFYLNCHRCNVKFKYK